MRTIIFAASILAALAVPAFAAPRHQLRTIPHTAIMMPTDFGAAAMVYDGTGYDGLGTLTGGPAGGFPNRN